MHLAYHFHFSSYYLPLHIILSHIHLTCHLFIYSSNYLLIVHLIIYCPFTYLLSIYLLSIDLSTAIICYICICYFYFNLPIQTWELLGAQQTPESIAPTEIQFSLCISLVFLDGLHYDHIGGWGNHCGWPTHGSRGPHATRHLSLILPRHMT